MNAPDQVSSPFTEEEQRAQEERLREVWEAPEGWRYWTEVNNTEVGIWYTATSFFFLLFAGALALLIRLELATPEGDLVSATTYNQLYTLHGTVMMFLFAVPVFEAFSILILPAILGARDLPFPRLSAYGYWCFLIGGVFVAGSIFFNAAPQAGWFMYPPLTTDTEQTGIGADIWLLGLSFIEVASIAAAVELIVGVLKCRPPGMRINLIPLYGWYILVVAGMILFAFPPLLAGDLLFELERMAGWPFFDASRGGDPVLWQHLFWIFGHPEVYIIFLPSIALMAMIVPTFAQRPLFGYAWIVLAAVGTGFLSFGLWVHHMFTVGLPAISQGFFSAASEAVVIPTGVQIFVFIATLLLGRVIPSVPMLFASGALVIFVIGGLTGVMVALAPFDWQAHDSYFVVAHLHYVLIGGMLFPVVAGIYYYFPLVGDRKLSDRLGRWAFWLMFAGFNIGFLPMHLTGLRGMPRRVFTYPEGLGLDWLNLVSTVGAFVFAAGVLIVAFDVLWPKRRARVSERNPWNAGTLEWAARIPPEAWGVRCVPVITSRYPLWEQERFLEKMDSGAFYLPDAEEKRRETIITSTLDAEPIQCLRLGGPTWLTLLAALFTGGVFIFPTFHLYWPALVSAALALVVILWWLWTGSAEIPEKPEKGVGLGLTLPLYLSGPRSCGWWAMFITMVGDATAFASLIFGYFFFWTVREGFPPESGAGPGIFWPTLGAGLLLFSWAGTWLARKRHAAWGGPGLRRALWMASGATMLGTAALLLGPWLNGLDPTAHAYPATVWVITLWAALHGTVGLIMQLYCIARSWARRLTPEHDIDLWNVSLYWHFLAATVVVTYAVTALFPLVA